MRSRQNICLKCMKYDRKPKPRKELRPTALQLEMRFLSPPVGLVWIPLVVWAGACGPKEFPGVRWRVLPARQSVPPHSWHPMGRASWRRQWATRSASVPPPLWVPMVGVTGDWGALFSYIVMVLGPGWLWHIKSVDPGWSLLDPHLSDEPDWRSGSP